MLVVDRAVFVVERDAVTDQASLFVGSRSDFVLRNAESGVGVTGRVISYIRGASVLDNMSGHVRLPGGE